MFERKIKKRRAVELITCPFCGNITDPSDDMYLRTEVNLNGKILECSVTTLVTTIVGGYKNPLSVCDECFDLFKETVRIFKKRLEKRKNRYDLEIVIKGKKNHG